MHNENYKQRKRVFSIMSNLKKQLSYKKKFQKADQHTGDNWFIHGTKLRRVNQLQSLELPCRIS